MFFFLLCVSLLICLYFNVNMSNKCLKYMSHTGTRWYESPRMVYDKFTISLRIAHESVTKYLSCQSFEHFKTFFNVLEQFILKKECTRMHILNFLHS